MVSIMGALEMLSEASGLDDTETELIEIAQRNATRQTTLIDAILEIARLQEGTIPLSRGYHAIGNLIDEALTLAKPRSTKKNLELIAQIAPDLPNAWIDSSLISRVLDNLIANAIKFSQPDSGPITVQVSQPVPTRIEVRVTDDGRGVPANERQRLFQKFAPGAHSAPRQWSRTRLLPAGVSRLTTAESG